MKGRGRSSVSRRLCVLLKALGSIPSLARTPHGDTGLDLTTYTLHSRPLLIVTKDPFYASSRFKTGVSLLLEQGTYLLVDLFPHGLLEEKGSGLSGNN